jgi:broad specificity phosphatase PhoE
VHAWRQRYDAAAAHPTGATLDATAWPRCYSSDMTRAYVTAQALYSGEIVQTPLLREADLAQFQTGRLLLPVPCGVGSCALPG